MRKFNEYITEVSSDYDPVKTGGGNIRDWEYNKFYKPKGVDITEVDPKAKALNKLSHAEYKFHVQEAYGKLDTAESLGTAPAPLLVFGRPGIGKTFVVRDVLEEMALQQPKVSNPEEPRKAVVFNKLEFDEQKLVLDNPGDYFVLIDVRTAQLETVDFVGVPKFNTTTGEVDRDRRAPQNYKEFLQTAKFKWAWLACHPDTKGYLFFDEVNQGEKDVINAMYAVILDRLIFDRKLSDGIAIIAAGNLASHDPAAQNEPLNQAFLRRFSSGTASLVADPDEWLLWAKQRKVHPSIIAFISSNKAQNFYREASSGFSENNRFPDPDSITTLSKFLYNVEKKFYSTPNGDYMEMIHDFDRIARSVVGADWAEDFINFITDNKFGEFISPKGLGAAQKWKNINIAQSISMRLTTTDPKLESPESKELAKALLNWQKKAGKDSAETAHSIIETHQLEGVTDDYVLFKSSLKEFSKDPESDNMTGEAEDLLQNTFGRGYKSDFERYSNAEESTNLLSVTHKTYLKTLEHAWESKESLLIYGDPGVGKSWAVKEFGKQRAKELGLEFAEIMSMSPSDLDAVIASPNDYFLYMDIRMAQMSPEDFIGIPDVFESETDYLETKPYMWVWLATRPNVTGILFFDELNQAKPQVLKAMYSVIDAADKFIFDRRISKDIFVVAAGNLASQESSGAKISQLPGALTRRFKAGTVVLKLNGEEWLQWALSKKGTKDEIHPLLLTFLTSRSNPENYIFYRSGSEDAPDLTPDTLRFASQRMRSVELNAQKAAESGMSEEEISRQFTTQMNSVIKMMFPVQYANELLDFIFKYMNIDWDYMIKNREMFSDPKALRQRGPEGKSLLSTIFAWIPFKMDVFKTILVEDPEMTSPITQRRIEEIVQMFIAYHNNYRTAFLFHMKQSVGVETLKLFANKYVNENKYLDPATKEQAWKILLDVMKMTKRAGEG